MIQAERVDFVSVLTQDLERAKRFYGETLGLRWNERANPDYPEFETGNLTLALVQAGAVGHGNSLMLHRRYAPYADGSKP